MYYSYALFIILLSFGTLTKQERINISIFYESLCPDSVRFIRDQFYPAFKQIGSYLNVTFVPYGKASQNIDSEGQWHFECQHGERECFGNKLQACALSLGYGQNKNAQVVYCVMSRSDPSSADTMQKCAEEVGIPWKDIYKCMTSGDGDEILAHLGDITHSLEPPLTYVPTITLNGYYNRTLSSELENYFLITVCRHFTEKPDACVQTVLSYNV